MRRTIAITLSTLAALAAAPVASAQHHGHASHGHSYIYGPSHHAGYRSHGHHRSYRHHRSYAYRYGSSYAAKPYLGGYHSSRYRSYARGHSGRHGSIAYASRVTTVYGSSHKRHGGATIRYGYETHGDSYRRPHKPTHERTYHREVRYESHDSPARMERRLEAAWHDLARGTEHAAARRFASIAETWPDRPEPKLGYALATAAKSRDATAIWAMRRALRFEHFDPAYAIADSERLTHLARDLRRHYQKLADTSYGKPDPHFMVAALSLLLHDFDHAARSAAAATEYGDNDASVRNLRDRIDHHRKAYKSDASRDARDSGEYEDQ